MRATELLVMLQDVAFNSLREELKQHSNLPPFDENRVQFKIGTVHLSPQFVYLHPDGKLNVAIIHFSLDETSFLIRRKDGVYDLRFWKMKTDQLAYMLIAGMFNK